MARVGILMVGDSGWVGGLYYSLNVIRLLRINNHYHSCSVSVFYGNSLPKEILNELQSFADVVLVNVDRKALLYRIYCFIYRKLTGKNIRIINEINKSKIEVLFPLINYSEDDLFLKVKRIYWLYDFQHKFLPHLFTKEEIEKRDINFQNIAYKGEHIVFSSYDSQDHFKRFYPESKARLNVFRFVSILNPNTIENVSISSYNLGDRFFIVSNQFWKHKNHMVVLQALKYLKEKGVLGKVVFTGNVKNSSKSDYFMELKKYVKENELSDLVCFTGFISREEQLAIMNSSVAVIQPSLFEGWSTVVEDAKALNKYIIASDIAINKEQVNTNVSFFKSDDAQVLSLHMESLLKKKMMNHDVHYSINEEQAYNSLVKILYSNN